ncbi:hypothetical protein [Streptomyces sp. NPDC014734]|uniref:hypothetical protein n=1 Tax=Streptomyces sp. NPDC014734 TaxID=3364886 RepID=UPI0036FF1EB2
MGTFLMASAVGLTTGCAGPRDEEKPATGRSVERRVPYWVGGMDSQTIAKRLGVRIPQDAVEVKAAYQKGFQDDGLLLAFVLPSGKVDEFLKELDPEEPVVTQEVPFAGEAVPVTPFAHLGLPEPDSLAGVRKAQVCAPCEDNLNALHVAVAALDGKRSRVYLKAID